MNLGWDITHRGLFFAAVVFCFGIGTAVYGEVAAIEWGTQSAVHKTVKSVGDAGGDLVMPFRIGERLEYRVAWASLANAGLLELSVAERRDLLGWGTWHFRATAHTSSLMRALMAVDDQFDSYTIQRRWRAGNMKRI